MLQGLGGGGGGGGGGDSPAVDNSEKVHVSSLALLKMLKHGRAGVPMEVMGLVLGNFGEWRGGGWRRRTIEEEEAKEEERGVRRRFVPTMPLHP